MDADNELRETLSRWQLDVAAVRERLYRAPTPREQERGHALWLAAQGWSIAQVAAALGRDAHTVGSSLAAFRQHGPAALAFAHSCGSRRLTAAQRATLKEAPCSTRRVRSASSKPAGTGRSCGS
jgi:hypothetical protein